MAAVNQKNTQVKMLVSTYKNVPNVIITHPQPANPRVGTDTTNRPVVAKEDLEVLSNWVKRELFEKVKFLYDTDRELQINGDLYYLFVSLCKDKLIGLKERNAVGEYRRLYVELLWQEANQKKRNLVANGLTMRRSSVYLAMQNRFVGTSFLVA